MTATTKNTFELKMTLQAAITTDHTGKMKGLHSLSTSCAVNPQCAKNAAIPESVCEKCFAAATIKRYSALDEKLKVNTALLTSEVLPVDVLPVIFNQYFRFEAFGDLMNAVQVVNYFNICNVNPLVNFALWTKNPRFIDQAMKEYGIKKPANLNIIYSPLFLNMPTPEVLKKYPFIDKVFTVYTADHLIENRDIQINCGGRSCANCLRCYAKNDVIYINECLKQDVKKARNAGIDIGE